MLVQKCFYMEKFVNKQCYGFQFFFFYSATWVLPEQPHVIRDCYSSYMWQLRKKHGKQWLATFPPASTRNASVMNTLSLSSAYSLLPRPCWHFVFVTKGLPFLRYKKNESFLVDLASFSWSSFFSRIGATPFFFCIGSFLSWSFLFSVLRLFCPIIVLCCIYFSPLPLFFPCPLCFP